MITDVRDTDDKKITSALEFNNIVKDILENNRGVWEYVIAFGNDGVVVRDNKQELGDIVTAYQQPRGSLTTLTKHNIEGLFKERDRSLFVWEKEGNKTYRVGDKIKVEGEGEAVIERLEKDDKGKTNACIRFPKDTECVVVKDFYRDIKYSAEDEKKSDEDANDDGVLKENDVVAILASEKNRRKDGRSFYLGKILKIRRVKDYSTEFIEIQDYHSQKEDTVYTLAFGKKKGKGVGPPITGIIGRDNVLTKVKSVKGLKGKLSKDELKRIRGLIERVKGK